MTDVLDERKKKNSLIFEGIAFENAKNKENPILVTSPRGRSLLEVGSMEVGKMEVGILEVRKFGSWKFGSWKLEEKTDDGCFG